MRMKANEVYTWNGEQGTIEELAALNYLTYDGMRRRIKGGHQCDFDMSEKGKTERDWFQRTYGDEAGLNMYRAIHREQREGGSI